MLRVILKEFFWLLHFFIKFAGGLVANDTVMDADCDGERYLGDWSLQSRNLCTYLKKGVYREAFLLNLVLSVDCPMVEMLWNPIFIHSQKWRSLIAKDSVAPQKVGYQIRKIIGKIPKRVDNKNSIILDLNILLFENLKHLHTAHGESDNKYFGFFSLIILVQNIFLEAYGISYDALNAGYQSSWSLAEPMAPLVHCMEIVAKFAQKQSHMGIPWHVVAETMDEKYNTFQICLWRETVATEA